MPHVFDPSIAHVLESEWRKRNFPAEKIIEVIEELDVKREVAIDVGAGTGYITLPLAKIFKKVYAIEISMEMAEKLRKNLEKEDIKNVGIIVTEKPPEFDFKIDLVIFSMVLHEMEKPEEYLCWSKRADYVIIAEWKKIEDDFGPPVNDRLSLDEILRLCPFKVVKVDESLPYHYIAALKS